MASTNTPLTIWEQWADIGTEVGIILAFSIILSLAVFQLFRLLVKKSVLKAQSWSSVFIRVANLPIQLAIWSFAFFSSMDVLAHYFAFISNFKLVTAGKQASFIIALAWLTIRWKNQLELMILEKYSKNTERQLQKATVSALTRLATILILCISGLMLLDIMGVPLSTLLAFGGAGAVASGLAAKDIVANFFGGFMIFVTRPFSIGDWINSPDKSIEGTVISIGWYMTCIRSFDKRPIYVPNALFSSLILVNPSRMSNRRILHTIGIRYDDMQVLPQIIKDVEQMLKFHPEIDNNQALMVHFVEFGAYSLNFNIYTFTKTTNWKKWREVQQDVLLKVAKIIESHGAQIAFPTQDIHLVKTATPEGSS